MIQKTFLSCLLAFSFTALSFATISLAAEPLVLNARSNDPHTPLLTIDFETTAESSGVCPLIVNRFEYLPAIQSLVLNAEKEEPCTNDRFGKSHGTFGWRMPSILMGKDLRLIVLLNGRVAGTVSVVNDVIVIRPL